MTPSSQLSALREALEKARKALELIATFDTTKHEDWPSIVGHMCAIAAEAYATTAPSSPEAQPGENNGLFNRVLDQFEADLKSAHAEICKLQGLDPATHSWPAWSPQANSLHWIKELRALATPTPTPREQEPEKALNIITDDFDIWVDRARALLRSSRFATPTPSQRETELETALREFLVAWDATQLSVVAQTTKVGRAIENFRALLSGSKP